VTGVCFFGAYVRDYPRNRILREGLARSGVEVVEAHVRDRRAWLRYPALARAFAGVAARADTVLVPEFRHKDVPLARLLGGRRTLVFDPLVSRHDTLVDDWSLHASGSMQARWNRGIDRAALSLADLVLCDTWAHGELYLSLGASPARLRRVLVGAEDAFFQAGPPPEGVPVRILYVGGFLPLHGVPVIVEAAARLEREGGALPPWRIELAGSGIELERARALAGERSLERVAFPGPVPRAALPGRLAAAQIVLGAFGAGGKAGRVIPHKVFQGLASGRAVLTGDGEGLREVFAPGTDLDAVPRGDPAALADALGSLIASPARRARLGERARARALEIASPERIGRSLKDAIEGRAEAA
jgi:glycosyltransferase involved in cell wall biosynthesis